MIATLILHGSDLNLVFEAIAFFKGWDSDHQPTLQPWDTEVDAVGAADGPQKLNEN